MSGPKFYQLVDRLRTATSNGTVQWRWAGNTNKGIEVYETDVGRYKVRFFFRPNEDGSDVDYVMSLLHNDKEVDAFTDVDLRESLHKSYIYMAQFYREAGHSAKGTTRAIEDIISELDKKDTSF